MGIRPRARPGAADRQRHRRGRTAEGLRSPAESKRAIVTHGRSAIDDLLDRDELLGYVIVTWFGLREA